MDETRDTLEGTIVGVNGIGGATGADMVGFDIPALRAEINTSVQQGVVMAYMSESRARKYMLAKATGKRIRITIEVVD